MQNLERITFGPAVMGGEPCLRGSRVTVGTVVGLAASGAARETIRAAYPYFRVGRHHGGPVLRGVAEEKELALVYPCGSSST